MSRSFAADWFRITGVNGKFVSYDCSASSFFTETVPDFDDDILDLLFNFC